GVTNATSSNVVVSPAAFTQMQVLAPGETATPGSISGKTGTPGAQTAGIAFNVTVRAVDNFWNAISTNDTINITVTDPNAIVPANAALVGGSASFTITFKTAGIRTATATNITNPLIAAGTSAAITVNPAAVARLQILLPGETAAAGTATGKTGTPASQTASVAILNGIVVNAVDAFWNVVSSSTPNITLTTSDGNAMVADDNGANPGQLTLVAGTKTLSSFTFKTAGIRTITAVDAGGLLSANTSPGITVTAGDFVKL